MIDPVGLPPYLDALYTADEMRAADRFAIDACGVSSDTLMERAGSGLAGVVASVAPRGPVRIVVGGGHNGADGLVAARVLRSHGREVDVLAITAPEHLHGDPRTALERLCGPPPVAFTSGALAGSAVVVDAMLGTGFEGVALEPVAGAIAALNACPAPTVAADVPSGIDASTGEAHGPAVRALVTATNHAPKVGLHVGVGATLAARVEVVDIGIPAGGPAVTTAGLVAARARHATAAAAVSPAGAPLVTLSGPELAERLGVTDDEVARRPFPSVRLAAGRTRAVVVLLAAPVLVAAPGGPVAVGGATVPSGFAPRLDALVAQGHDPFAAAAAALAG